MRHVLLLTLLASLAAGIGPGSAHAQFSPLTRRIPTDVNAVALIDVQAVLGSPLAAAEGWADDAAAAFHSGMLVIPPTADRFVAAGKVDVHTAKVSSEVYIFDLHDEPNVAEVATRLNGTVDNLGGYQAAVLPGDYFLVKFTPRYCVLGHPADRQSAAAYVRRVDGEPMHPPDYVVEAEEFAKRGTPIIMAVDLTDSVSPQAVRRWLDGAESLKGSTVERDAVAKVLSSVRGIMLGVTIDRAMTGSVKVDFAEDVDVLGDAAGPLLLEAFEDRGLTIDELQDWEVRRQGKTVQFLGRLEASGLRRLTSLLPAPPSLRGAARASAKQDDATQEKELAAKASQAYFKSVQSLLDDLKAHKKERKTMGQVQVWFRSYADRIDRLSMVHVDPMLLDYGSFVSTSLRNGSVSMQGIAGQTMVDQLAVPQQYDYQSWSVPMGANLFGSYGWGGWSATPNDAETGGLQAQVRMEGQVRGGMASSVVLQQVDNATAQVRRAMTQKYQVDF